MADRRLIGAFAGQIGAYGAVGAILGGVGGGLAGGAIGAGTVVFDIFSTLGGQNPIRRIPILGAALYAPAHLGAFLAEFAEGAPKVRLS